MRRGWMVAAGVLAAGGLAVAGYAALPSGHPGGSGPVAVVSRSPVRSASPVRSGAAAGEPTHKPAVVPTGEACVAATVAAMSLDARVGQTLMVGTPIANPAGIIDVVRRYRLGGVFLAGRGTQTSATVKDSIRTLQSAAVAATGMPVQVALDQEGGQVQSLRGNDFPVIPSAVAQGRWDSVTLRDRTVDWATRLSHAGLTMDLASVADTVPAGTERANPPIGALDRQYGSAPDAVAQDIATVVSAAQSAGIVTTLKHFPGLGRVRLNTDTSSRAVDEVTTVDDPFLRPFAAGIQAGTGAVMVSSATYLRLDPGNIAAFSTPVVTGLLRQRLGFTGVVVSDDLGAAAAVAGVPVGERAVRFLAAGGDLVLTVRPADAGPMVAALLAAARQAPAFTARVTEAATRVVRSKVRAGLLTCPPAR